MQSASTDRIVRARSFDRGHSSSSPSLQPGIVIATRPGGLDGVKSASSRICEKVLTKKREEEKARRHAKGKEG